MKNRLRILVVAAAVCGANLLVARELAAASFEGCNTGATCGPTQGCSIESVLGCFCKCNSTNCNCVVE